VVKAIDCHATYEQPEHRSLLGVAGPHRSWK
jgi:hypothetical protein